jgi:hypothetical protein
MIGQRASWLILALAAGAWCGACEAPPTAPGESQFMWSASPEVLSVRQGASGSVAIRLNSKVNINSNVDLSVSGTVPNGTLTLTPLHLGSTGRDAGLSVQTTAQTPVGSYQVQIRATEVGYGDHTIDVRVDVSGTAPDAADFLLEVTPTEFTFTNPAQSGPTIAYFIRPQNNFAGTVNISVDGLDAPPAPLYLALPITLPQITFQAGDGGRGGTFVPAVAARPSYPRTWTLTVRAVSGSIVHTMPVAFTLGFVAR